MALIVFLRGINVGGHRTFRPSMLARDLAAYDAVNVGAAGTLVVRKPGSRNHGRMPMRKPPVSMTAGTIEISVGEIEKIGI